MPRYVRTDMACESPHLKSPEEAAKHGIFADRELVSGFELLSVEIKTPEGAGALGKPMGKYFTLNLTRGKRMLPEDLPDCAGAIAGLIRRCAPADIRGNVLVAALGNPDITPDALGPIAASSILVTRHLREQNIPGFEGFASTSLCRTGVLGTTGMESAAQIKALCAYFKPSLLIAVDALAGSEADRLCKTVQVCDSGISPGSGVGNDRDELSYASLGLPVVALGVPTVIDASSLCARKEIKSMFVTPRDIDSQVRSAAKLVAYGINLALHPGLSVEDMELLLA